MIDKNCFPRKSHSCIECLVCFREKYQDFTSPIHGRKYYAIFREPELQQVDIFAAQFNPRVWSALFLMILLLQIVMAFMNKLVDKTEKEGRRRERGGGRGERGKDSLENHRPKCANLEARFQTIDVIGWAFGKFSLAKQN